MKNALRLVAATIMIAACLVLPSHLPVHAGGNIEITDSTGQAILNAAWDKRSLPIAWKLNVGGGFSGAQLRPEVEGALDTWQNLPDNDWAFTFIGGTAVNAPAVDGNNVFIFGSSFTSVPGFIGVTPCTAINAAQTVADTAGPPPDVLGDGLGWLRVGSTNVLLLPTGTYPAGTVADCDTLYNTAFVCSTNTNVLCDPATFNPIFDCGSSAATCDPFIPFSRTGAAGAEEIQGITLHESGHFGTLAHSTVPNAIMYPFADTNPSGDGGIGNTILKQDDISASAHYYKDANYLTGNGQITGNVTILVDNDASPGSPPFNPAVIGGDGVAVTALDAATLEPVAAHFSYSFFLNSSDPFDGADRATFGDGFFRLDVPPGDYFLFAEWLDGRDDEYFGNRLWQRHNLTTANSSVADGDDADFAGEFGLLPERFEFHNTNESGDGGDGSTPGAAADNPDEAFMLTVGAGQVVTGADIAINLDPDGTKSNAARSNPTGVARVDLTPFDRLALLLLDNDGNDDDWWLPHFPAAELPAVPYNVQEAIWTKFGLADQPYIGGLLLGDPNDPNTIEPFIVYDSRRTVTGYDGGNTGNTEIFEVRDRFNVTVNQPRDLYFAIKLPESPSSFTFASQGYFAMVNNNGVCDNSPATECNIDADCPGNGLCNTGSTGQSLLTPDNFLNFFVTNRHDVLYRVKTEVAPPVMINSASPASLAQGESGTVVTITGSGFKSGAAVDILAPTFSGPVPSGVTVTGVSFVSSSQLDVTVDVDPFASTGILDVKVTNPEVVIPNLARLMALVPAPDSDGDTFVDPVDCLPLNGDVWSVPGTVGKTVQVDFSSPGVARVAWADPADPGGTSAALVSLVGDVVRGDMATLRSSLGLDYGTCFMDNVGTNQVTDGTALSSGETRFYIVSGDNVCGNGPYTGPSGSVNRNASPGNC